MPTAAEVAVEALSYTSFAVLRDGVTSLEGLTDDPVAAAVTAMVRVLACDFDGAVAQLPRCAEGPLARDITEFVRAVCLAEVPHTEDGPATDEPELAGVRQFLGVETALSSGQINVAEERARGALADLDAGPGTGNAYWAWALTALARALVFQGRVEEARSAIGLVLSSRQRHRWPAVDLIARGVEAFVAAHAGDPAPATAYAAEIVEHLPRPAGYLESSAFVLAGFARAASGELDEAAELVLHGGGGEDLQRLQVVDRVYCYEILVEAALAGQGIGPARRWAALADLLPVQQHAMAAAAVERIHGRVALADHDADTGVRALSDARLRAASVGGTLEVVRAQILLAVARPGAHQGSLADLEEVVQLAAGTGADLIRDWADRELGALGRRLRNAPGRGWAALSDRQQVVARLAARGLRNREIGAQLFLSERTVEGHLAAVLEALGAPRRMSIAPLLPEDDPREGTSGITGLTHRQRQVVTLVATGQTNAQIAATLQVSAKTVEKHLADAFRRLGVQSRAGVAALFR